MTLSNAFLRLAVIAALVGMIWGNVMGATHDHSTASAHAHLNLLGWVSMSIYGLFYRVVPAAAAGLLPRVHFWLNVLTVVAMVPALGVVLTGIAPLMPIAGPVLALTGLTMLISMLLFAVIVFRNTSNKAAIAA